MLRLFSSKSQKIHLWVMSRMRTNLTRRMSPNNNQYKLKSQWWIRASSNRVRPTTLTQRACKKCLTDSFGDRFQGQRAFAPRKQQLRIRQTLAKMNLCRVIAFECRQKDREGWKRFRKNIEKVLSRRPWSAKTRMTSMCAHCAMRHSKMGRDWADTWVASTKVRAIPIKGRCKCATNAHSIALCSASPNISMIRKLDVRPMSSILIEPSSDDANRRSETTS